jgi:predicted nucleotidyltransferase
LNNIRQDILNTLAYFDIFNYPLTKDDILSFLPQKCPQLVIDEMLASLLQDEFIFKLDEFYSLQNKPALAERRRCGNQRAKKQMAIAKKIAKILSWFPFVQTVAVSGSLSKNYADEKSDIDFFIITSANRLWIARSFMHFLKKISYLAGKQNWFCMNYYVDKIGMEIKEKNIFTAMEIVTLRPMQGADCFQNFIKANSWTNKYFPAQSNSINQCGNIKKIFLRKWVEKIFNSALGDHVEKWLMNLTDKRWKKKTQQGKVNEHGVRIGMIASPHFSKPDPEIFQAKVVQQYETRIKKLAELREVVSITL